MISAQIITDLILKRDNNYSEIFSPLRFKNKESKTEENKINSFKNQKIEFTESVGKTIIEMTNNQAKLVESELGTLAIYKDNDSNVFVLEGKCSHMGCNLHFDNAERIWECPCHGSVFDYKGNVIRAPAIENLKNMDSSGS